MGICSGSDPETLKPVADGEIGLLSYMDASSTAYPAFIVTDDIGIVKKLENQILTQG